jgi:hypothetical protein
MIRQRILIIGEIASGTCLTPLRWYNHLRARYIDESHSFNYMQYFKIVLLYFKFNLKLCQLLVLLKIHIRLIHIPKQTGGRDDIAIE